MFFKLIVDNGLVWFLKSITFIILSFDRRQYFKFSSDAVCNLLPIKFQQKDTKSDLFFFSDLFDFNGD